jgi:DNA-directed RNA polymerase subunit RPC12/RpoP
MATASYHRPAHEDNYTPPRPDVAVCPICGAEVPAVATDAPGLYIAALSYRCTTCGKRWGECRGERFEGACLREWGYHSEQTTEGVTQ